MTTEIIKRNGTKVPFNSSKICTAIQKAAYATNTSLNAMQLTKEVISKIFPNEIPSVEEIQDLVEQTLIQHRFGKAAKAYILYREEHNRIRNTDTFIKKLFTDVTDIPSSDLNMKRENANINTDTAMGAMLKYGSEMSKHYLNHYLLPHDIAKANLDGDIHIHDADFYLLTETCCQIDILSLLKYGFCTGHGTVRAAQSIESCAALTCIVLQSNQNEMHGGQSIPNFDYGMAYGVHKSYRKNFIKNLTRIFSDYTGKTDSEIIPKVQEDISAVENLIKQPTQLNNDCRYINALEFKGYPKFLISKAIQRTVTDTNRQTYQAMESLLHNLNTMHSRAGAQVPFTSINYGTDTSPEGRMAMKNLLLATIAGLGNGETPIFPVQIFKVKEGVNFNANDPNYDLFKLAIKTSAKRLFPNFSFLDAPFNAKYYKPNDYNHEVAYMGCVAGQETIFIKSNDDIACIPIESAYETVKRHIPEKCFGDSRYLDIEYENIKIWDSNSHRFVKVKKIIKNPNRNNWLLITTADRSLTCTEDHPLPVYKRGRVYAKDIHIGDNLLKAPMLPSILNSPLRSAFDKKLSKITSIKSVDRDGFSYDVETETDRFDVSGIQSFNCRTRVMGNICDPSKEVTCGRGNLSFTSINLPRIGIESNHNIDMFFTILDQRIDLCIRQLLHRFKIQCHRHVYNYPFLMGQNIWIDSDKLSNTSTLESVLKHGTLTVGFIGLAETLVALTGKHHGESEESQKLGLKIIGHMRKRMDEESQKSGLNFTLIATPAEGLSGQFTALDKQKFGIIPGVTDREYYTNSFHVPVYFPISAFRKIEIEAPYHALTNGGHITYVELARGKHLNVWIPYTFPSVRGNCSKPKIGAFTGALRLRELVHMLFLPIIRRAGGKPSSRPALLCSIGL